MLATGNKLAFDCYRRPVCFVVPPQLLGATLVYLSELFVLKSSLFKAANHQTVQSELQKFVSTEHAVKLLGFTSPNHTSSRAVQSLIGHQVLQLDLGQEADTSLCDREGIWLGEFPQCTIQVQDVHSLAAVFLEDVFYSF